MHCSGPRMRVIIARTFHFVMLKKCNYFKEEMRNFWAELWAFWFPAELKIGGWKSAANRFIGEKLKQETKRRSAYFQCRLTNQRKRLKPLNEKSFEK